MAWPDHIQGEWKANDPRRAFVAGAAWWELMTTSATMWSSDRRLAEDEAEKHYPGGKLPRVENKQPTNEEAAARELAIHGVMVEYNEEQVRDDETNLAPVGVIYEAYWFVGVGSHGGVAPSLRKAMKRCLHCCKIGDWWLLEDDIRLVSLFIDVSERWLDGWQSKYKWDRFPKEPEKE